MIEKTKNTKLKPIRFDDTRHAVEKRLADNVVSAKALLCGDYQEHGRSYYSIKCGFCSGYFNAFKWSLRGSGKRCPHCKAIMGSSFEMFQWKEVIQSLKRCHDAN